MLQQHHSASITLFKWQTGNLTRVKEMDIIGQLKVKSMNDMYLSMTKFN